MSVVTQITPQAKAPALDAKGLIKRVFSENARDYLGSYAIATFCLLLISGSTAFVAWIMRDVIDKIFYERNQNVILIISASVFGAFLIRGLASYMQAVIFARVGNNLAARYQRRLVEKLMSLDMRFFSGTHSGTLSAQLNQNVAGIRDILNVTLTSFARDFMTLVALIGVMVYQDPLLSLFTITAAPPLIFGVNYLARRVRSVVRESVVLNSKLLGAIQESTQGVAVVKAYTMESAIVARVDGLIKSAENRANKITNISERTAPIAETLAGLTVASVIAYSGFRAVHQAIPPGATFAFITALLLAYDPARRLANLQVTMTRALVNAQMVYDILDLKAREPDGANAKPLIVTKGEVRFDKVDFAYDADNPVLRTTSFIAKAGETTAIVGPSGSGKSTIANLILRFYDPANGAISIDGTDIKTVTKQSLRNAIAYVSQAPYMFEGSIRDNIRFGRADATDSEVEAAAKLANAHNFIVEQPNGYDTEAGENGTMLSGGQRQRISIARAMLRNAPILLLDEATSSLDNESERLVQQALETAMKGRTTIVIAHRLSTIIHANKIITLMDGQIAEEGTHDQLVNAKHGIYARFFAMQNGKQIEDKPVEKPKVKRAAKGAPK